MKVPKDLKTKYPDADLIILESDDDKRQEFVFKKPNRQVVKKFYNDVMKDAFNAQWNLLINLLVWPDKDLVIKEFEESPGLVGGMASSLLSSIGGNVSFVVKKFKG